MRLALIGFPIRHSRSPGLFQELLGAELECYDLLEFSSPGEIPSLRELGARYHGINVTAPYKEHFLPQLAAVPPEVRALRAVNTIKLGPERFAGINTDLVAVREILARYQQEHPGLAIALLGNGAMARITCLVARELEIPLTQFFRGQGIDLQHLDLSQVAGEHPVLLVINSCGRGFVFQGPLPKESLFWDYNYDFLPHQNTLPLRTKSYCDGREMLRLQALAALEFWHAN
jgi:shikimate dehydrogenase